MLRRGGRRSNYCAPLAAPNSTGWRPLPSRTISISCPRRRVRQADARARQAGAILPALDADGTATEFAGRSGGTTGHEPDWGGLLSASYEVDLWSKNRAAARSARTHAAASRAEAATLRIRALVGLADTYHRSRGFPLASRIHGTIRQALKALPAGTNR